MRIVKNVVCPHCGQEISKSNFTKHLRRHENHPETFNKNTIHVNHDGLNCQYCGKLCKSKNSLAQHEIRCSQNPNRFIQSNYINGMLGKTAWNKGLTKETDSRVAKGSQTYQDNKKAGLHKDTSGQNNSMNKFPEARLKISKTCLEKSANGEWHTSLCKNNHYNYKGVDLHCKWELEYAVWLDEHNIKWERPKNRFKYIYKEKEHYYTPDFYLVENKEYVEIKGYSTGKDYAKWKQFPKNLKLVILKRKQLNELGVPIK